MRFFIAFLLLTNILRAQDLPPNADLITYDWLIQSKTHPEVAIFHQIFSKVKVKNLLEFGVGAPTKYFLDRCNKVVSVEFVTYGCGPENIRKYINFYQEAYNWVPVVFFTGYPGDTGWATYKYLGSYAVYKAVSYQSANQRSYASVDDFYILEMNAFVKSITKMRPINVAFVNCSLYLRGDLVQIMFDKSPIIVANSTSVRYQGLSDDVYGYSRIQTPANYEEIFISQDGGLTVWIEKKEEYSSLIDTLRHYASNPL
jgi:hypothetical protein